MLKTKDNLDHFKQVLTDTRAVCDDEIDIDNATATQFRSTECRVLPIVCMGKGCLPLYNAKWQSVSYYHYNTIHDWLARLRPNQTDIHTQKKINGIMNHQSHRFPEASLLFRTR